MGRSGPVRTLQGEVLLWFKPTRFWSFSTFFLEVLPWLSATSPLPKEEKKVLFFFSSFLPLEVSFILLCACQSTLIFTSVLNRVERVWCAFPTV